MTWSISPRLAALAILAFGFTSACQSNEDPGPPPGPLSSEAACLIGSWRETSHTWVDDEGVSWSGAGAVQRFAADGTGALDYGDGARFSASIDGQRWEFVITGTATFRYRVNGAVIDYSHGKASGNIRLEIDGVTQQDHPRDPETTFTPDSFTCQGDALTLKSGSIDVALTRTSR